MGEIRSKRCEGVGITWCPSSVLTARFSSISHLFPSRIFRTVSEACCLMFLIQFRMFSKLCLSVTSYTRRMPIAPR